MDKIFAFAFELWNKGVHKLVSLSEEYQIGEHANHYKYAVLILILLGILAILAFICLLTLAAMGTLHQYSRWVFTTCFKVGSILTISWLCYEQFYAPVRWEYYPLNVFYLIVVVWAIGIASFGLYIVSKIIYVLVKLCCPLPTREHFE